MDMGGGSASGEPQISIVAPTMFPGFRFSPTDEELISYYLKKKIEGDHKCVEVISEIEIWKHEPWDLPAKSVIRSENEWFFFSPRGRKYPNGSQSRRATELGYWKATGKERNVKSGSNFIGTKRTLVFHIGRAPKGERTEWIMHEYCMNEKSQDSMVICRLRKNSEFRQNDTTNLASSSQQQLSPRQNSNCAVSGVGIEQGDKTVEDHSKKCSSSYDSYSIEQIDSASESNQKCTTEVTQPESSGHQKDYEEDFYADILNDDIIKLDESSISTTPNMFPLVANNAEAEQKCELPAQATPSQTTPFQGTAKRRLRLGKQAAKQGGDRRSSLETSNNDYLIRKIGCSNSLKQSPKSISSARVTVNFNLLFVVFVFMTLMVLFLSLFGGFRHVKRITNNTL
ncbi:NAC domain-containing protein 40 [Ziziphus jujuba]|uniref:NAC domain-containing protein 40 n=2 Tax=Ziziphus jujuba TaxID=326968 RepID=A0A6P3ZCS3_ZIZJJ|nr:NAC domain-containing protein 40 [Ziziphus jujuba]KAH7541777.1 hypothetical protein FEM48_Zijuj02G0003600 [Ziziphus jujuba var. spinosa]